MKKVNITAVNKWTCTSCDTLILKPGKPIFVFYNIHAVYDQNEFRYIKQLKASDLTDSSANYKYQLYTVPFAKREWNELQKHYPNNKFNYKYIFKHTYIKVLNSSLEKINMLTLSDEDTGFIYWSGKPGDKVIKRKEMYQLTELIAKYRKVKFRSSYMLKYEQDSTAIADHKTVFKPTREAARQAMYFAVNLKFKNHYLPLQLFNLKDVKEMVLTNVTHRNKNIQLDFNSKGQIVKMLDDRGAVSIEYKDDAPHFFTEPSQQNQEFNYSGDTLFVNNKWNRKLDQYTLVGNFYFKTKSYLLYDPAPFKKELVLGRNELIKRIDHSTELILQTNHSNADELDMLTRPDAQDQDVPMVTYVSSIDGTVPLTIKYKTYYDNQYTELIEERFMDGKGNLILNKTIGSIRRHHVFKMKQNRPVSLSIKYQVLSDDGKTVIDELSSKDTKPEMINFSYKYYND
ncbi:hypothetical protein H7F33_06435 [Pedobacter sp. PAMC26386]|nr:hypothetical protein H7F33_06435 [Pedobacter sp. PAMC26386]